MQIPEMIIEATRDVLSTMIGVEAVAGPPRHERIRTLRESVSGMIGFSGDTRGMVAVHVPAATASFVTTEMLGMEVEELGPDVRDAVGEISNMIAGNLKIAFGERGENVEVSVPTTVAGAAYDLNCLSQAECVTIPFSLPAGEFLVEYKQIVSK